MKLDCEKFIMEIVRLNKRKEFSISLLHKLNPLICLKVKKMRKSYNHAYAGIFVKYGIFAEDLYEELDNIWFEICVIFKMILFSVVSVNPYFMVTAKWKSYKRKALELAKKRCKEQQQKEGN